MNFSKKKYEKNLEIAKAILGEKSDNKVSIDPDLSVITEAEWMAIYLMESEAK